MAQPVSDKEWQAQDDARTLAEAERIKQDKTRLAAAQAQAKKMAADKQEEAKAMSKIAGQDSGTDDAKKPSTEPLKGSANSFNVGVRIR